MSAEPIDPPRRNLPILAGQGAFAVIAWILASPGVVLTFLVVSLELPIFLAGLLVAIRHASGTFADIFLSKTVSGMSRKKHVIAAADIAIGAGFILLIAITAYGSRPMMVAAFIAGIFVIGVIQEFKTMMITDFLSDNLQSDSRMRVHYTQLALGSIGAIALALIAHLLMEGSPPLLRHSTVVAIGAACFVASAVSMMAFSETVTVKTPASRLSAAPVDRIRDFFSDAGWLLGLSWFRKYMAVRLSFIIVGLSVPFFALIAADAHHTSARGLTALIISSAAGMMVAAPLWRVLNGYSNRAVMLAGTLMIAISSMVLIAIHWAGSSHNIHLHAASLFVATVAVTGLSGARGLHFMDVAPKSQRVAALAVSKSTSRIVLIAFSAIAAAIAHTQDIVWAVFGIMIASLTAAAVCLAYVQPNADGNADD